MKLYFVRHGRTLWNLEGRFQGASGDSPLLPDSIDILKQLGQYLKEIPFDTIYSSDLPRAVKSAEIIQSQLQAPCPLKSIPDLREWQLGKLEGLKITTLNSIYPQQIKAFRSNLAQFDTMSHFLRYSHFIINSREIHGYSLKTKKNLTIGIKFHYFS